MAKKYLTDIDLNKNQLQNAVVHALATAPSSGVIGQIYYNTTDKNLYQHNGTTWVKVASGAITSISGTAPISVTGSGESRTVSISAASGSAAGSMSSAHYTKLEGIATGAEVNQNAFSNVKVGSTTVAADSKTDTLELAAGTNITLTPDATNDKVTIATSAEVNQNAFSKVAVSGQTTVEADAKTDTLTLAAGSNVTLTTDATNDKVTIAASHPSAGTQAQLEAGSDTNNRIWQPKILHDYVASAVGAVDAMRFKGTIGTGGDVQSLPTSGVKVGDTYRVITAGTYAGQTCEIGDLIINTGQSIPSMDYTWTVAQTNIDGAITSISGTSPISVTGSGSSRTIAIGAASGSAAGSMSSAHYTKLEGIAAGAEVNQNAFSNVQANNSSGTSLGTIAADGKTDTLTIQAGSNVTLTADTTNDKLTIASSYVDTKNTAGSTDTSSKIFLIGATSQAANPQTYSHDTAYVGTDGCLYSGGTKVLTSHQTYTAVTGKPTANQTPGFGSTFTISQISQATSGQVSATDRTVKIPDTAASSSANGLMSSADKVYIDRFKNKVYTVGTAVIQAGQTSVTIGCALTYFQAFDYVSGEEVVVDVSYNSSSNTATFSINAAYTNDISINYISGAYTPTS